MLKYIIALVGVVLIGVVVWKKNHHDEPVQPQPQPQQVEPQLKLERRPDVPQVQPQAPLTASPSYIRGYRDGFSGTWVAPGRWLVVNDYRHGWQAGAYDRQNNKPNRYPG